MSYSTEIVPRLVQWQLLVTVLATGRNTGWEIQGEDWEKKNKSVASAIFSLVNEALKLPQDSEKDAIKDHWITWLSYNSQGEIMLQEGSWVSLRCVGCAPQPSDKHNRCYRSGCRTRMALACPWKSSCSECAVLWEDLILRSPKRRAAQNNRLESIPRS